MAKIVSPADMHLHLRQGEVTRHLIEAHLKGGFKTVLAMPNTSPPVSRVLESDEGDGWSIEGYRAFLVGEGADAFETLIVPAYLTAASTPRMIERGVRSGLLSTFKSYPPHGTTNSSHGVPLSGLIGGDTLRAMAEHGVILCVHGERHGVHGEEWLGRRSNAEEIFYREEMPRLRDAHPDLKVSCEHVTTKVAVDFVTQAGYGATITPMHLTYTLGDLVQNWWAHLKCMPIVKFDEDVEACRKAVTSPGNTKFYAGTDSAPHPKAAKSTDCGCASGCFTGSAGVQLYARAFELAGCDIETEEGSRVFEAFMSLNGPAYHGVPPGTGELVVERGIETCEAIDTPVGEIVPLPVGLLPDAPGRKADLSWRIVR